MSGTFDLQDSIGLVETSGVSNTVTVGAADVAAVGSVGVTSPSPGQFTVNPQTGSIIDNFWNGTFGAPAPTDPTEFALAIADPTQNIITFTETTGDGNILSAIGVEILGVNSQGVFGEQINDYFNGAPPSYVQMNLNANEFFVFSKDDLSVTEPGFAGPAAATLMFGPTVCFAAGTRIGCASGDVAVEDLRVGDHVILADGGTLPIVWIGHRRIDCRRHPDPDSVLPIRVTPGAFGEQEPKRPLFLSPEHAVYTDGVLIPIRHLLNGSTICQVDRETVTYFHVELERHEVLFAEGLRAESYLDATCNRSWFDNGPLRAPRGPERVDVIREGFAYAQFVTTGEKLDAVRQRLIANAGRLCLDLPRGAHIASVMAQATVTPN